LVIKTDECGLFFCILCGIKCPCLELTQVALRAVRSIRFCSQRGVCIKAFQMVVIPVEKLYISGVLIACGDVGFCCKVLQFRV
jgi:hypothetical protein